MPVAFNVTEEETLDPEEKEIVISSNGGVMEVFETSKYLISLPLSSQLGDNNITKFCEIVLAVVEIYACEGDVCLICNERLKNIPL